MKVWNSGQVYDFYIEFNRLEMYNEYCKSWLNNYYNYGIENFKSKTDWTITDIVDLVNYNRVKTNINILCGALDIPKLDSNSYQVNQLWTSKKANDLETRVYNALDIISNWQFSYEITGLAICGNNLRLGGVK